MVRREGEVKNRASSTIKSLESVPEMRSFERNRTSVSPLISLRDLFLRFCARKGDRERVLPCSVLSLRCRMSLATIKRIKALRVERPGIVRFHNSIVIFLGDDKFRRVALTRALSSTKCWEPLPGDVLAEIKSIA